MNPEALIAAALAQPITHEVVTVYADGTERRHGVRSERAAKHCADREARKIGRDLISRETGQRVRVVSVSVEVFRAIPLARA